MDNSDSSISYPPAQSIGSTNTSRQLNKMEAHILDYVYRNNLLNETVHIDMWQQFADEIGQDVGSSFDLKMMFHCEILQYIGEYNLPYEMKRYFSGLKAYPEYETVMRDNDFLFGRDFITNQPPPEIESPVPTVGELTKLSTHRPFDATEKLAVVQLRLTVCEMPKFTRLMYSCFLDGVPEGKAAKMFDIVRSYTNAVFIGDVWINRIEEDSIINMAACIDMADLTALFDGWDILEDDGSDIEMPTPDAADIRSQQPLCSSTPVSSLDSRSGMNSARPRLSAIIEADLESELSFTSEQTQGSTNLVHCGSKRPSNVLGDPLEGTSSMYGKQVRRQRKA